MGREYKEAYLDLFKGLARDRGIYIVGGSLFYFNDEDGRYYNASFLFDPDGGVREQRKTHRAYELVYNREMVTAGEELEVFETDFGRVGITICYDAAFPETARILMLGGRRSSSTPRALSQVVEAFDAMERRAIKGFGHPDLRLHAPYVHKTKAEIVEIGTSLSVPYEDTWSCYEGGEIHCGLSVWDLQRAQRGLSGRGRPRSNQVWRVIHPDGVGAYPQE